MNEIKAHDIKVNDEKKENTTAYTVKLGFREGFILSRIIKKLNVKTFIKNDIKKQVSEIVEKIFNKGEDKEKVYESQEELKKAIIENTKKKLDNKIDPEFRNSILYVFSEIIFYMMENIHEVEDDICLLFEKCTGKNPDDIDDLNVLYSFLGCVFNLALPKMFSDIFSANDIKKNLLK